MSGLIDIKGLGGLRLDADPWDAGLQVAIRADNVQFGAGGGVGVRSEIGVGGGQWFGAVSATEDIVGLAHAPTSASAGVTFVSKTESGVASLHAQAGTLPGSTLESSADYTTAWSSNSARDIQIAPFAQANTLTRVVVTDRTGNAQPMLYTMGTGLAAIGGGLSTNPYAFCGVWADQNRLVVACSPSGASSTANPHIVRFSDPGDPTTWGATSYVQLNPGGGDPIVGVGSWRELFFVLKGREAFVFYGVSTLSNGAAEFQWRPVQLPSRPLSSRALTSTPFGLLVACQDGIYLSTGGDFTRWGPGEALRPLFGRGTGSSAIFNGTLAGTSYTAFGSGTELCWVCGRLFVVRAAGEAYVWQEEQDAWARWTDDYSSLGGGFTGLTVDAAGSLVGYLNSETNHYLSSLLPANPSYATQSVEGVYISGLGDLGMAGLKSVRRTMLEARATGSGAQIGLGYWSDLGLAAAPTSDLDVTSTGVGLDRVWDTQSVRGRKLGVALSLYRCEVLGMQAHLTGSAPDLQVVA